MALYAYAPGPLYASRIPPILSKPCRKYHGTPTSLFTESGLCATPKSHDLRGFGYSWFKNFVIWRSRPRNFVIYMVWSGRCPETLCFTWFGVGTLCVYVAWHWKRGLASGPRVFTWLSVGQTKQPCVFTWFGIGPCVFTLFDVQRRRKHMACSYRTSANVADGPSRFSFDKALDAKMRKNERSAVCGA